MNLENKVQKNEIKRKQNVSWKQRISKVVIPIVTPFLISNFLSSTNAVKANELDYFPAQNQEQTLRTDFNRDGIVDFKDLAMFTDYWLAEKESRKIISVYECGCLDEPNALYIQQNDVETDGTCFEIQANGIRLNLNNKNIIGDSIGKEDYGIHVDRYDNVTISNGNSIVGFQRGIYLANNKNNKINNIHEFANKYGIYLESCSENVISDIDGFFDRYGIYLKSSSDNKIERIVAGDCSYDAVSLVDSSNNILENVVLWGNGENGLKMLGSCNNTIKNSVLDGNNFVDVYLDDNSIDNIFLDTNNWCSFPSDFVEEIYEGSSLIRSWSYRSYVQDSSGKPVVNAVVSAYDNRESLEAKTRTLADGKTTEIPLISYINRGGTKEEFAPYTITAEKDEIILTHVYYPGETNQEDIFVFDKKQQKINIGKK